MSAIAVPVHGATRLKWWALWAGRVITILPVLILLTSARWKLTSNPWYVAEWGRIGYAESALRGVALLQLACVVLYLIPPTAVLGAVLLTGYLGGAVATHVRAYDFKDLPPSIILGVLAWVGLWLRDPRLRALAPWRS